MITLEKKLLDLKNLRQIAKNLWDKDFVIIANIFAMKLASIIRKT